MSSYSGYANVDRGSTPLKSDTMEGVRGVAAASAGNHAVAVAYAAAHHVPAKVIVPRTADAVRVASCRSFGAQVGIAETLQEAHAMARRIGEQGGCAMVPAFEGYLTATGTATLGAELLRQVPDLDVVVAPIGGGGLIGGMAAHLKQVYPRCVVIGVVPAATDTFCEACRRVGRNRQPPRSAWLIA